MLTMIVNGLQGECMDSEIRYVNLSDFEMDVDRRWRLMEYRYYFKFYRRFEDLPKKIQIPVVEAAYNRFIVDKVWNEDIQKWEKAL